MEKDFWIGRWQRGEIGWHQSEAEPGLVAHFPKGRRRRVLVPLCGKSLDMKWLAEQGHEVVGVELSELGVRAFFEENQLSFTESQTGSFQVFRSGLYTIYRGDFFELTPEMLGPIDAIYDRAALIALPPEMRRRYAAHVQSLMRACARPGFEQLQIVLERVPHDEKGPPHSVREQELRELYDGGFSIERLSRERIETTDERSVDECVYRFVPR